MKEAVLVAYFLHHFAVPQPALQPSYQQQEESSSVSVRIEEQHTVTAVANGAQRVPLLRFSAQNSCDGQATIEGLSLRHTGLGNTRDIDGIYAFANGARISSVRKIYNSDSRLQLNLNKTNLLPCETISILLLADFSQTAAVAGQHALTLEGVQATASVQFSTNPTRQTAGSTGTTSSALDVEVLPLNRASVRTGTNRVVGRLRFTAGPRRDMQIESIRLTNAGSAREGINNIYLHGSARQLTNKQPSLTQDYVVLEFYPPLVVRANSSRTVNIRADVFASIRKSLQFTVQEPNDVFATYRRSNR